MEFLNWKALLEKIQVTGFQSLPQVEVFLQGAAAISQKGEGPVQ
jgi:hypothetical protein